MVSGPCICGGIGGGIGGGDRAGAAKPIGFQEFRFKHFFFRTLAWYAARIAVVESLATLVVLSLAALDGRWWLYARNCSLGEGSAGDPGTYAVLTEGMGESALGYAPGIRYVISGDISGEAEGVSMRCPSPVGSASPSGAARWMGSVIGSAL